jgi:hypothetical protein
VRYTTPRTLSFHPPTHPPTPPPPPQIETNEDSPYRECIKSNPEFYLRWVLPKLRSYINHNGWKQPDIACLGDEGIFRESDSNLLATETAPSELDDILEDGSPGDQVHLLLRSLLRPPLPPPQISFAAGLVTVPSPVFYPYIEGSLYKKGNGIISSVWSYRHFELDLQEQTLRWYKVNHTSSPPTRIYRGSISIRFATAELFEDKQSNRHKKNKTSDKKKSSSSWKHLSGEIFVVKYYPALSPPPPPSPRPTEAAAADVTNESKPHRQEQEQQALSGPSGSTQEMYLSAPCLQEAHHWITHLNISSKIHFQSKPPPKPQPPAPPAGAAICPPDPSPPRPSSSSAAATAAAFSFSSLFLWMVISLLPLVVFLFPEPYRLYIALVFVYSTPPLLLSFNHHQGKGEGGKVKVQ